jgi:hypothetical protein
MAAVDDVLKDRERRAIERIELGVDELRKAEAHEHTGRIIRWSQSRGEDTEYIRSPALIREFFMR